MASFWAHRLYNRQFSSGIQSNGKVAHVSIGLHVWDNQHPPRRWNHGEVPEHGLGKKNVLKAIQLTAK